MDIIYVLACLHDTTLTQQEGLKSLQYIITTLSNFKIYNKNKD